MRRLLLPFALASLGCATTHEAAGPGQSGGDAPQVDLLARGFLVRGQAVTPGFGYYAYLVFLDAGETTRPQREAAAHAFARLLEDVRDVEALQVPRERLAVLYLPVVRELPVAAPAEQLLDAYDYSTAQLLTVEIGRRGVALPRLFLMGSTSPIQPRSTALPSDVRVVELKGDPQAIETTVLRFRATLLSPGRPALAQALLERVRSFFDSVGGFVLSVGAVGGTPSTP